MFNKWLSSSAKGGSSSSFNSAQQMGVKLLVGCSRKVVIAATIYGLFGIPA
jgi:hypothetical protein